MIKDFSVVSEAEVEVFLEFPCFFYDSTDAGNLISGSSALSKSTLYICKFLVHILLKPTLKDFEHNTASMWNVYIFEKDIYNTDKEFVSFHLFMSSLISFISIL